MRQIASLLSLGTFTSSLFLTAAAAQADQLVRWGWNNDGQINVPAGNDYVPVAAGSEHSLALKVDVTLFNWRGNYFG